MNKRRKTGGISWLYWALVILLVIIIVILAILLVVEKNKRPGRASVYNVENVEQYRPEIDVELLTPNMYSRPETPVGTITGIVIHYVANPGTSAIDNRNYFEGLKDSHETYASSHFIVGLEGEIVQCIPTSEVAYASNERNSDTVSIEVCHPDETGKFKNVTYDSLVELTGWLCEYLHVPVENVIRHYDVTGKLCPLYYVEHEDAWVQFKDDVYQWVERHQ